MKVELDKLVVTSVERELPERCPKCKINLVDDEEPRLTEDQLLLSSQDAYLLKDGVDSGDGFENDTEVAHTTGYRCKACNETLVSTDGED